MEQSKREHWILGVEHIMEPVDEGEQRHQEINGWIPLQRLYLLSQRHLSPLPLWVEGAKPRLHPLIGYVDYSGVTADHEEDEGEEWDVPYPKSPSYVVACDPARESERGGEREGGAGRE